MFAVGLPSKFGLPSDNVTKIPYTKIYKITHDPS